MKKLYLCAVVLAVMSLLAVSCRREGNLTVKADNENILYMGRVLLDDSIGARFNYPGTTAMLNFEGTGLSMSANGNSGQFMVEIDGNEPFKINFTDSIDTIVLADSMEWGSHSARVTYAIEGHEKRPAIHGFEIFGPDAKLLPPPARPQKKIEFIGNSITCGYGTEADSGQVHFSFETENHTLSFAYLTARALDLDVNVVARSGIGMYRSYGGLREGTPGNRIPDIYDRTLYYSPDYMWDHKSFEPDVIFINLGTNDTSLDDYDIDLFVDMYNSFVDRLRELHPQAKIVLATGSMLNGETLEIMKAAHDRVVQGREDVYRFDFSPCTGELGYGADFHPSRAQSAKMAGELVPYLRDMLGAED